MGKVKRMRQKFHNAAQKSKAQEKQKSEDQAMDSSDLMPPPPPMDPTAMGAKDENLFKDIDIRSLALVKQKLPDFDAQSSVTSKTFKGLNLTKKEKKKFRHDAWMAKIDHIKSAEKQTKEKKKKSQKAQASLVGNLTPMLDALPTLELLMKSSPKQQQSDVPPKARSTQTEKHRKSQMLKDISLFQQVLKHPLFVKDERATITEHLKIAMEKGAT